MTVGCACALHPMYAPLNSWNLGAAVVHVGGDGAFEVRNYRMMGGVMVQ